MGNFNARIGRKTDNKETAVENFGMGNRDGRGGMLIDFALKNKLQTTNSFFYKKLYRKWIWRESHNYVKK